MEVFVNTNSVLKVAVSHHPIITDGGEISHQHLHSTHSAATYRGRAWLRMWKLAEVASRCVEANAVDLPAQWESRACFHY